MKIGTASLLVTPLSVQVRFPDTPEVARKHLALFVLELNQIPVAGITMLSTVIKDQPIRHHNIYESETV